MKAEKILIASIAASVTLLVLISWSFYETLKTGPQRRIKLNNGQEKAVMAQARQMKQASLNLIAESGKVVPGMNENQVRLALGEPESEDVVASKQGGRTVWWYQHQGWLGVVYDSSGVVTNIQSGQDQK